MHLYIVKIHVLVYIMNLISVIVTTYNWPAALKLCLDSLFSQCGQTFEIIIADDGSTPANQTLIQAYCAKSPVPIRYVYHDDQGFRAGTIRNKAVADSHGDYLLFIDGDCVCRSDFVYRHKLLAESGHFVTGNRVMLSEAYTQEVIEKKIPLPDKPLDYFLFLWLQGKSNRIAAFLQIPLGFIRGLRAQKWQKAKTCNLAVWKNDFLRVNGFDEFFEGWGYEDSDLVIRLIHAGIKRKDGRFAAPVVHLWHPQNDKSHQEINFKRLMERLKQRDFIVAVKGISQYL